MATVMLMRWEGVTPDQYEAARAKIRWEEDVPNGAQFHVAGFDGGALRVLDIWDSREDFERFVEQRLMPGVREVGIEGDPDVLYYPAHAIFAPAYESSPASA